MMRTKTGIVCVVAALAVGACSWGGSGSSNPSPDASGNGGAAVCGDGVCASSEVTSCSQDCGNGGGNQNAVCGNGQCETSKGESATSCPTDCNTGSGGGSNTGSGGGGGALNCSDPNTQIGCLLCTTLQMCTAPYDATSCAACGGGGGGGSGLGCVGGLPNGTCDPGEDANNCPFDCP
jgi:hypothetical protein